MTANEDTSTYTARWVFPVAGSPLSHGTVTVRGNLIEAVEPYGVRTPDTDLGNVAIIPGLVNPHMHLDLSGAHGRIPPTDPDHFTDWLRGVIAYRRSRSSSDTRADIRAGLNECLRFGTTLLGDVAAEGEAWDEFPNFPIRTVVFQELMGLTEERARTSFERGERWLGRADAQGRFRRNGLSPHAPYSARVSLIADSARACRAALNPMTIHLAESIHEWELLAHRSGPFVDFLAALGVWEPAGLASHTDQIVPIADCQQPQLFIHANYLPTRTRMSANQSIVFCPRTHAAFGHPPHPFRDFLRHGVRVCLGTDSLASTPDLDILAEARFLHHHDPDLPGDTLLRMVTLSGAEALGWADEAGSLESGKSADLVAVPLPDHDANEPHELLLGERAVCGSRRTMFRGRWREGA